MKSIFEGVIFVASMVATTVAALALVGAFSWDLVPRAIAAAILFVANIIIAYKAMGKVQKESQLERARRENRQRPWTEIGDRWERNGVPHE